MDVEPFRPAVDSALELIVDEMVTNAVQQEQQATCAADASDTDRTVGTILVTWRLAAQVIYVEVRSGSASATPGGDDPGVPTLAAPGDFEDVSGDVAELDKILDTLAESGRGLVLVDGLSRDWGWYRTDDGEMAVWSVIDR